MITVRANARNATYISDDLITSGSVGIPVTFVLSEDFDGLSAIAVFEGSGTARDVALIGNTCVVPHEVVATAGGYLRVGIYASNAEGTIVIPTVWAGNKMILQGTEPSELDPSEPTPSWAAQVQAAAAEAVQTSEEAIEIAGGAEAAAEEARQSASAAAASATEAGQSANAAGTAQAAAEEASDEAASARDAAVAAQGSAASSAQAAAGSATAAAGSAEAAAASEAAAREVKESIPQDYTALSEDVSELKSQLDYGKTVNLIDPIHKSGTVDGISYSFDNGRIGLTGTASGRILMQTITGNVGDKFSLSCLNMAGGKPTFYVMNGSTVVSTYRQSEMNNTFTLPVETVTLEFYVSGAFSYDFALTLVKDEIPHFPLNLFADSDETTVNFADVTYEAIGDSLTYGFTGSWTEGVQNRINTPYPEKVKEILGMAAAINKGETGTTIANDTDKMGTYYPISNDNRLSGYSYAPVISVMGSTNDFAKGTALGTIYDSLTATTFHAGWKRIFNNIVNRFSSYNAFIFVIIPPVTQDLFTDNSAGVKWIDYINATMEECRGYGVPVLDMSLMGRLSQANKAIYTSDGIHFNQLYVSRIFAPMVADFIKRNIH